MKERKEAKQGKMKIWVGCVVTENVVDMEKNTREGRSRRIMNYFVVCVHSVVGKNKFLVQFEDG